jgi:hypothetical protein
MKKAVAFICVVVLGFSAFGCQPRTWYAEDNLAYLTDNDYVNKKALMPDYSELKYLYVYLYTQAGEVGILLDFELSVIYGGGSYVLFAREDINSRAEITRETKARAINILERYKITSWRKTYAGLSLREGATWFVSLEFNDGYIFRYQGNEGVWAGTPENLYDFFEEWDRLAYETIPGYINVYYYPAYPEDEEELMGKLVPNNRAAPKAPRRLSR